MQGASLQELASRTGMSVRVIRMLLLPTARKLACAPADDCERLAHVLKRLALAPMDGLAVARRSIFPRQLLGNLAFCFADGPGFRLDAAGDGRPAGAGLGLGLLFVLIAQVPEDRTYLSLAVARGASLMTMAVFSLVRRRFTTPSLRLLPVIALVGILDTLGNVFFVLSAQVGRLDVASVLSALYPLVTVLLALILLRERLHRPQGWGVALTLVAIPLIAAGGA
ncbi:MAG: DMT family transporter [Blastochloris sp.]|nr:DMT family transporter [Blastochloris sp.]